MKLFLNRVAQSYKSDEDKKIIAIWSRIKKNSLAAEIVVILIYDLCDLLCGFLCAP